jgi:hypothetical protein
MSHDLRWQRLHGTESANATEDDGEAPVRPSHGALSAICNYGSEENSSGTERSEDSEEANERIMEARQLEEEYLRNKAAMEQRHRNIQKRKLERRGFGDENDSVSHDAESDADLRPCVKRRKTPYRIILYYPVEF